MDAAGKYFVDSDLNEGWNIIRWFHPRTAEKASFAGMRAPFVNPTVLSCNRYDGCQNDFENAIMNLIGGMTSGRSGNFLDEAFETPRIATHDTDPIATRQAMMGWTAPRHQRAKMVVVETPSEGKPPMGKSIRKFAAVTRVGIDLAKRVFQVHAVDARGEIVVARKLTRSRLVAFFSELPHCVVAMEACSSAHHWGRQLLARIGHRQEAQGG